MRVILLLIFFVVVSSATAQEKPRAVLVDEFSRIMNCEDVSARFDNFLLQLQNNPDNKGLALITSETGRPKFALTVQEHIRQWLIVRRLEEQSPDIVFTKPAKESKVQFWLIPGDAESPKYDAAQPGEIFAGLSEPFLYNTEFGGEVCPAINPKLLANLVNSNPNINVRVVVREKTVKSRKRKMNEWLLRLVTDEKIPRERVHFVLSRKLVPYFPYQDVEFWIVPIRK